MKEVEAGGLVRHPQLTHVSSFSCACSACTENISEGHKLSSLRPIADHHQEVLSRVFFSFSFSANIF